MTVIRGFRYSFSVIYIEEIDDILVYIRKTGYISCSREFREGTGGNHNIGVSANFYI